MEETKEKTGFKLREKRPVYTMDIMRLMTVNELSKTADFFYIQLERGARDQIVPLRATLKTLYGKIRRFCKAKYPEESLKVENAFNTLDTTFNFEYIEQNDEEKYIKAKKSLILIKELIEELIDEIWVKFYEVIPEEERARLYSLRNI